MTITTFTIPAPDQIRGDQLVDEILQATGIDVSGRYMFYPPDEVRIAGDDVATAQAQIQAVVDAHVPDPLYFPEDVERQRAEDAETTVANIPGWATWTEAEALAWHDANITDPLAAAPTVTSGNAVAVLQSVIDLLRDYLGAESRAFIQLQIALRNKTWPNLEGS